jgi:HSP20 family molecular chaperone IbpA
MSNVTLWSRPWDTDRWLREFFGPATNDWFKPLTSAAGFSPAAEIVKDGDDAVVRLELPGMDIEKDVTVELDRRNLVVHGERRDEHASEDPGNDSRRLREVRYGSFRRSFPLPAHITSEALSASYDAGVLTVRVAGAYKNPAGTAAQRIAINT